jgi:hypothetical protein
VRALAWICAALAVLAAIATAALVGIALFPQEDAPGLGYALVAFATAVVLGALAVRLLD